MILSQAQFHNSAEFGREVLLDGYVLKMLIFHKLDETSMQSFCGFQRRERVHVEFAGLFPSACFMMAEFGSLLSW